MRQKTWPGLTTEFKEFKEKAFYPCQDTLGYLNNVLFWKLMFINSFVPFNYLLSESAPSMYLHDTKNKDSMATEAMLAS